MQLNLRIRAARADVLLQREERLRVWLVGVDDESGDVVARPEKGRGADVHDELAGWGSTEPRHPALHVELAK